MQCTIEKFLKPIFVSSVLLGSAYLCAQTLDLINNDGYKHGTANTVNFITLGLSAGLFFGFAFYTNVFKK